jgi:hypothetical protein
MTNQNSFGYTDFEMLVTKVDTWDNILNHNYIQPNVVSPIRMFLFQNALGKIVVAIDNIRNAKMKMSVEYREYLDIKKKLLSSPQDDQLLEKIQSLEKEISSLYQLRVDEAVCLAKKYRFLSRF